MEPQTTRPQMPAEYGVPRDERELLPWSHVSQRMRTAKHYWLATVTPGGAPHCRPIAGMWVDDRLYFGGSADSRWARNLLSNQQVSIHLEDADQPVILEGTVAAVTPGPALAERIAAASNEKYGQSQTADDYQPGPIGEFTPKTAFAWTALYRDATRWHFA